MNLFVFDEGMMYYGYLLKSRNFLGARKQQLLSNFSKCLFNAFCVSGTVLAALEIQW